MMLPTVFSLYFQTDTIVLFYTSKEEKTEKTEK